jgi:hypothetical protein
VASIRPAKWVAFIKVLTRPRYFCPSTNFALSPDRALSLPTSFKIIPFLKASEPATLAGEKAQE